MSQDVTLWGHAGTTSMMEEEEGEMFADTLGLYVQEKNIDLAPVL